MVGNYLSRKLDYENSLKRWVDEIVSNKLWKSYTDLHVDEVAEEFKDRNNWVSGSIFLLNSLMQLIDRSSYEVMLVIPLSCVSTSINKCFDDLNAIETELDDMTPPSFYLFPKNQDVISKTIAPCKYLTKISQSEKLHFFYGENKENDEFYRTIFIRSN